MDRQIKLSPSLMTMNLDHFKEEITFLNDKVNSYHIDIMDGHFVPNITLSPWFIEQVRKISDTPMSAHLMVTDPTFWVQQLIDVKCETICMPAEVVNGVAFRLIDQIHDAGLKAGMVLNPETPVDSLMPYLDQLDKITELRKLRDEKGYHYEIEMDGSTNKAHWKMLSDANPDIYIIGHSGLFGLQDNIEDSWKQMVNEYEDATGYKFDDGVWANN